MQIIRIDLENVKSYERATVPFAPGTNAIVGHNGAGKSTILEAIGFALFDTLLTTQDQLVREGAKTASVTVHIVAPDGRPFQVMRKCGSTSQHTVYDPEIHEKLTDGKTETMRWLRDFAGVERSGDLSALFRDAIGVPQGLLTAAFLETASRRKDVFNPLLRVDEYEEVWRGLREPASSLRDAIAQEEQRVARLEGEVTALPEEQERAADLRLAISEDHVERERAQEELDRVASRKREMEETKARLEELERDLAKAAGEVRTREVQWREAEQAVRSAEAARATVADAESGHLAYLRAEEALDRLEDERRERDGLEDRRRAADKALALARGEIERWDEQLEEIARAEADLSRLAPRVAAQDTLEADLRAAQREVDRLEDRRSMLEEGRQRLSTLEERLGRVRKGLAEKAEVEAGLQGLEAELRAVDEARDPLRAELAGCRAELGQLQQQTETLSSIDEATCPVCEGPLTPEHRAELLERNRAERRRLEETLDSLQTRGRQLEDARRDRRARLDQHQQRLAALPRPREAEDLSKQVAELEAAVARLEEEVAALSGAPLRTAELRRELEELGDPRREHARAVDIANRRGPVEASLGRAQVRVRELGSQLTALEDELAYYVDLDGRIENQRRTREANAAEHQRHLAHVREAETLEERRARAAHQEEALALARADRARLAEERDRVAEGYDATAHQELVAAHDRLRSEIATLEESLRHRRGRLEETLERIDHLMRVQAELERARLQREELAELLSLLETLRQVVREAGPRVTRALVSVISAQAAQLYADIVGDHTGRLRWTDEYEILLRSAGRDRGFAQLSGGEQMAAALAVRLALLKEVSSINLAFFDEPTANLDDQRRDSLAEQILRVKGFSQLFVISHDDTFEQDTDHVVRVVKEDGQSRVVAG